jgi:hypothetical protein
MEVEIEMVVDEEDDEVQNENDFVTPMVLRELKIWHVIISTCINLLDIPRMHSLG